MTKWLVSSLAGLDSITSLHTNNNMCSSLEESKPVKLETSCTVILPPPYGECCLATGFT